MVCCAWLLLLEVRCRAAGCAFRKRDVVRPQSCSICAYRCFLLDLINTWFHCSLLHTVLHTQMIPQAAGKGIKIRWITDAENCLVYCDLMHMGLVLIILDMNAGCRHTNIWNLLAVKLAVIVLSVALLTMFGRRRAVPFPRPTHAQLCYCHIVFVHFFPGTLFVIFILFGSLAPEPG